MSSDKIDPKFENEFLQFLEANQMASTADAFRRELSQRGRNASHVPEEERRHTEQQHSTATTSHHNHHRRDELAAERTEGQNRRASLEQPPPKPMTEKHASPTSLSPKDTSNANNSSSSANANASSPPSARKKTEEDEVEATKSGSRPASARAVSAGPSSKPLVAAARYEDMPKMPDDEPMTWEDGDIGVLQFEGDEDELWDIDDHEPSASPAYLLGAGISQERFLKAVQDDEGREIAFEETNPYQKQPPPKGLPLESFDLRVVYEAGRTGFEDAKEFPIVVGSVIAGRYQVTEYLGSAAFSRAVQCVDLKHNVYVCMKIIRNSKDFFDQSLDEIKLLQFINSNCNPDEKHVLQLFDYFYHKEHMFLVCELLRDNLYEFSKYNREQESDPYFTLVRVQHIAKQVLTALAYVHSLGLLHCDLKPENILIKSYSRCEIKVIDFGSSCFTTDNLSSYVQSRCYRAPEVILGCKYDGKIDIWSLGAILPELMTGHVLFHNESLPGMLARITALCGPLPRSILLEGRHTCRYVTTHGAFYERTSDDDLIFSLPKRTKLANLLGNDDPDYVDFITRCLTLDPKYRPSCAELLEHPFILKDLGPIQPA